MSSAATMQQVKTDAAPKGVQHTQQLATHSDQDTRNAFVDTRPRTTTQRRLQEVANHSEQSKQLKAFQQTAEQSARAVQLKAISTTMNTPAAQRAEKEEPLQAKLVGETVQREATADAAKPNNTGLPDQLKTGVESLSGMSMDHVKVHYNSPQPAQLNAYAYAQGSEIHVAPGQEQHLPHEAWHVVQQAQGRVQPTMQMKEGVPVNDDTGLEREADVMGARAMGVVAQAKKATQPTAVFGNAVQLYSYAAGSTKTITLKNAASTEQANIDVCTQNSVTYAAGDAKQAGTDTGVAAWAGWLTDAGTNNNATQLHVINQTLGGNGGASDGNIGPGSQNLNSHHLHQAEKFVKKELFDGSDKATHGFTFTCSFDYSNSVDKVHNTPTAKDTAIGDPAIKAKVTYASTSPAVKTAGLTALESGVDVTNGYNMKFGKA